MEKSIFSEYLDSINLDNRLFGEDEAYRKADLILKKGYYHTNVLSPFFTKFSKNREFSFAQTLHNNLVANGIRHWSQEEERFRQDAIRRSIPPIMIVTLPKSGSVYIQQNISQALKIPHIQISLARFPNDYILSESLKIFSEGGAIAQTHLDPREETLNLISSAGIRKIHVHVRDPRQATVSWAKYIANEIVGELAHQRHLVDPPLPSNFDSINENEKLEWFANNHYPFCLRWIAQWVNISQRDHRFQITFSDHSELLKSNKILISRIIGQFDSNIFINQADIENPEHGKAHFRQGGNDEWIAALPPGIKNWMNAIMPKALSERFGWKLP